MYLHIQYVYSIQYMFELKYGGKDPTPISVMEEVSLPTLWQLEWLQGLMLVTLSVMYNP